MEAISRRRLWSLATVALGLGAARAARADLPDCASREDYDGFSISANISQKGELSYDVILSIVTVQAPTPSGSVDVAPLNYRYSADEGESLYLSVYGNDDDAAFAPDEIGVYEIFSGNARIAAVSFSPKDGGGQVSNPRVVVQRMFQADSIVRVTLGQSATQWRVGAAQFRGALDRAASVARALQNDYANGRCQGADSCLMTTVACRTLGLDDDCFELRTVRRLRDGWLLHQPGGAAETAWYYRIAPALLMAIPPARRERVFLRFYIARLVPAVALERLGCHGLAFRWLKQGVLRLARRYRPEALALL